MKVDLHVHTKERSNCARSSAIEQIEAAIDAGLDAIALTDHGHLPPVDEMTRLNDEYAPFRILDGIEISVIDEDVLIVGIRDPLIIKEQWDYPDLHGFVRERGGLLAVAHPYRYHADITIPLHEFPPDAIEACSNNTPPAATERILSVARGLEIPVLSNSDAHVAESLGNHYNLLDGEPADQKELIERIKQGLFTAIVHEADGTTREFM